jgi:hypothetical protein
MGLLIAKKTGEAEQEGVVLLHQAKEEKREFRLL